MVDWNSLKRRCEQHTLSDRSLKWPHGLTNPSKRVQNQIEGIQGKSETVKVEVRILSPPFSPTQLMFGQIMQIQQAAQQSQQAVAAS